MATEVEARMIVFILMQEAHQGVTLEVAVEVNIEVAVVILEAVEETLEAVAVETFVVVEDIRDHLNIMVEDSPAEEAMVFQKIRHSKNLEIILMKINLSTVSTKLLKAIQ